jgi:ABC-2 type transport system permease protein
MTAVATESLLPSPDLIPRRRTFAASRVAFGSLLLRDAVVLRKTLKEFIPRTLLQPFLLVFVFTYVFPKIGQGVGGAGASSSEFSTVLVAGVVGLSIMFQGVQSVALPMVQEFGYTREIEDRVLAPLPVPMVAATEVHLHINWLVLLTLTPLACYMCGALGLTFGTFFDPRTVPLLFGIIVLPLTFLGAAYYSWSSLASIKWLQILILANPLVYMCEGFRAALTTVPHMSLWVIYPVMVGFSALFTWVGIRNFKRRVLS